MSTSTLLIIAILVFSLMLTGLFLTAREFLKVSYEPSQVKNTATTESASRGS
jgi:hypothetical protein